MKVEIVKEFYGAEDGINTKLYKKGQKLDLEKEFADKIIDKGYAKFNDGKETKVVEPDETKKQSKKKK